VGGIDGANWPKKRWRGPLKCAHLSRAPCFAGARSVLGLPVEQVVRAAWPTELLEQGQQWYCENAQRNWDALRLKQLPQKSLWVCARLTTGSPSKNLFEWGLVTPQADESGGPRATGYFGEGE